MDLITFTAQAIVEAGELALFDLEYSKAAMAQSGVTPRLQARMARAIDAIELAQRPEKWLTIQAAPWVDLDSRVRVEFAILVGVA